MPDPGDAGSAVAPVAKAAAIAVAMQLAATRPLLAQSATLLLLQCDVTPESSAFREERARVEESRRDLRGLRQVPQCTPTGSNPQRVPGELEDRVRQDYVAPVEFARARQLVEAVAAHDFETAEDLLDPDVETVTPRGTLRGIAACRQVLQKASGDEQFAMEQAEPEFEQIGDDVIAWTREIARWRETGEVAYERDFACA